MKARPHFVAGQWLGDEAGASASLPALVHRALASAHSAAPAWQEVGVEAREQRVGLLLKRIETCADALAQTIAEETGKLPGEASAEVDASLAEGRYQLDHVSHHLRVNQAGFELRRCPLGVVLAITPWNFPLATIVRKLVPALVAGNVIILKPSEFAPRTAEQLVQLAEQVEFPTGVITLVQGEGVSCVPQLLGRNVIKAVSLTGSCEAGQAVAGLLGARDIRLQAELGGSNAAVVCADADIEVAAAEVVDAAFACGGQWCTGTGRVIVEQAVHDEFLAMVSRLVAEKYGAGGGAMGAQANARQLDNVHQLVNDAQGEGASIAAQGTGDDLGRPNFYPATVLSGVTAEMRCARSEVFGPVLLVLKARDFDQAVAQVNASAFGLSVSLYTSDETRAESFIERANAGLVHVNLPTPHRALEAPLFGWNASGRGWPECGPAMLDFFTRPKVVYRT